MHTTKIRARLGGAAAALTTLWPGHSLAQSPPAVDSGTPVRVTAATESLFDRRATFLRWAGDSLVVAVREDRAGTAVRTIPASRLHGLEVATAARTRGQGAWRGAKVGFLVGFAPSAVATGIAAYSDYNGGCRDCIIPASLVIGVLGVGLTATTTLTGTLVGAANPGYVWRRVPLPARVGVRPWLGPAGEGRGVAVRLGF